MYSEINQVFDDPEKRKAINELFNEALNAIDFSVNGLATAIGMSVNRLRYLQGVGLIDMREDSETAPTIKTENSIEQLKLALFYNYVIEKLEISPSELESILMEDDPALLQKVKTHISHKGVYDFFHSPIDPGDEILEEVSFYQYMIPRLCELMFGLLYQAVVPRTALIIPIQQPQQPLAEDKPFICVSGSKAINRELQKYDAVMVASVDHNGTIHVAYEDITFVQDDHYHLLSISGEYTVLTVLPNQIAERYKSIIEESINNPVHLAVLNRFIAWVLKSIWARKDNNSIYRSTLGLVRTTQYARDLRVEKFADWLMDCGEDAWSFAVVLKPEDVQAPRILQPLFTIACSEKGPYRGINFKLTDERSYSIQAYSIGHISSSGKKPRGYAVPGDLEPDTVSSIAVPLVDNEFVNGVLYIACETEYEFTEADELLLAMLGFILGEMLSDSLTHRRDNRNLARIVQNPRILSPNLNALRSRKDALEKFAEVIEKEEFTIIITDLVGLSEIVKKDANKNFFSNQVEVDLFCNWLAFLWHDSLKRMFSQIDTVQIGDTIYQDRLDRFIYITEGTMNIDAIEASLGRELRKAKHRPFGSSTLTADFLREEFIFCVGVIRRGKSGDLSVYNINSNEALYNELEHVLQEAYGQYNKSEDHESFYEILDLI